MSRIDEHCVIATRTISPVFNGMNSFVLHATNIRLIAQGVKSVDGRSVDGDFLVEGRKVWNIMCT